MARVLIAGSGYVGRALGIRLASEGHLVWGLCRRASRQPTAMTAVEADLSVPNTLRHLPLVDHVFYLASPAGPGVESHRSTRVDGFRYLVAALLAQRQRVHLYYGSCLGEGTAGLFGPGDGRWVDEDSAAAPGGAEAEMTIAGERLAAEAPFDATVLRMGAIYGPGRAGLLDRARRGAMIAPSDLSQHENRVHRDDCVEAMAHLLSLPTRAPLYLLVDGAPAPRAEVLRWLAAELNLPEPAVDGATPGTGEGTANVGVRAMGDRLAESGFKLRYPTYRRGYAALVSRAR